MSNVDAVRTELALAERRLRPRLGMIGGVALLTLAMAAAAAEIHFLPMFGGDDVGAILLGLG